MWVPSKHRGLCAVYCEFDAFLGLDGYQVSQQKAQLIKEKEGSNLLGSQDTNAELPSSRHCVTAWRLSVPVGQT
ncbi:Uncharacterised protein [Chlamydia abortus]|nr:Uncharacterised protein [Chlamydia abortus]